MTRPARTASRGALSFSSVALLVGAVWYLLRGSSDSWRTQMVIHASVFVASLLWWLVEVVRARGASGQAADAGAP